MKKVFLIFAIFFISKASIYSQVEHNSNLIKFNPFGGFASAIPISYERFFCNNNFSALTNFTIISNKSGVAQSTYNNKGLSISPELRYYFYKDNKLPLKLYGGAFYIYEQHENKSLDRLGDPIIGEAKGNGAGLLFGNQWFLSNGIVIDMYLGPAYNQFKITEEYDTNIGKSGLINSIVGKKNSGTKIRIGFTIGLSF